MAENTHTDYTVQDIDNGRIYKIKQVRDRRGVTEDTLFKYEVRMIEGK